MGRPAKTKPFMERFTVNIDTGCWEWTGCINKKGYADKYYVMELLK